MRQDCSTAGDVKPHRSGSENNPDLFDSLDLTHCPTDHVRLD